MPIGDPVIHVECDKCGEVSDPMNLTALAQSGSWDERNIKPRLKRDGWTIDGNTTICPECTPAGSCKGSGG